MNAAEIMELFDNLNIQKADIKSDMATHANPSDEFTAAMDRFNAVETELSAIEDLVSLIEDHTEAVYDAAVSIFGAHYAQDALVNGAYVGTYDSMANYIQDNLLATLGLEDVNPNWIDFNAIERDLMHDYSVTASGDGGVFIFQD